MTPLPGMPEPDAARPPEPLERRIRRAIMLVAAAAVLVTAVPFVILSVASGVGLEQRKAGFVAAQIERNLRQRVEAYVADITGLAAAPILGTGLTDSAGRQAYLGPFLAQRAAATASRLRLFDYRGRLLLDTAAEVPVPPPVAAMPRETTSLVLEESVSVAAPIRFFANQRLIGALEGQVPLRGLVADAAQGLTDDYHLTVLHDGRLVFATAAAPLLGDPAAGVSLTLALADAPAALRLELRPRLGWFAAHSRMIVLVMLGAIFCTLLLALLAARRIARVLTAPIAALVQASAEFRAGGVPDLGGPEEVQEIAGLAEALAAAFRARDSAQAEAVRYTERMLEGLPVAVFHARVDARGGFELDYLSPSITRISGWPVKALRRDADWAERIVPVTLAPGGPAPGGLPGFLQGVHEAGEGISEFHLRCLDGGLIWLRERSRSLGRAEAGGPVEVVGTLMDCSLERGFQAQAVAAGKLALLGEMATGLAHELSQPLAVMSLAAENAARSLRSRGDEAVGGALGRLDRIVAQAARARGIVDHLRIFARREEPAALDAVTLAQAVEGALTLVAGPLRSSGVAVEVALPADLPPIRASLIPLEQILVNLLLNARDAMGDPAPAGARVRISAAGEAGERVVLRLRDTGPGIPAEVLERIFEPFFTTKESGKGTGLGLSICHGTMRSFGGAIEAANLPEGGAEFRLRFQAAETPAVPGLPAARVA